MGNAAKLSVLRWRKGLGHGMKGKREAIRFVNVGMSEEQEQLN